MPTAAILVSPLSCYGAAMNKAALALVALTLAGCGPQELSGPLDLDELGISTEGERGGRTYAAFDAERDSEPGERFMGFDCLWSCDGHEAGFAWAEDNDVRDEADCGGNSWAFMEGCAAFTIEAQDAFNDDPDRPDRGLF